MADHPAQIPNRTARKSRTILAVLILLLPLGSLAYSSASAAVPLGSLPVIEELWISGEGAMTFSDMCWDGQRLWGLTFDSNFTSTLYPVDMLTHQTGPGLVTPRYITTMTCNGQYFFGSRPDSEIVWAFDRQGVVAAHYLLPKHVWVEDMAWDEVTPGGPYLWVTSKWLMHQFRLTDPLTRVSSFDLVRLVVAAGANSYGSLAMDGQSIWIVTQGEQMPAQLLKINPADRTPEQVYSIPAVQDGWLQLVADSQSAGGPFLYLLPGAGINSTSRLIYKLSTIGQDWQVSYLPLVRSWLKPTTTPLPYPWP